VECPVLFQNIPKNSLIKDDFSSLLSEIEQKQLMDKDDNIIDHKYLISLLVPNQTRILAFILSLVPNISDAEDIYQEPVSTMWEKFLHSKKEPILLHGQ
jgi:hypothetical protein